MTAGRSVLIQPVFLKAPESSDHTTSRRKDPAVDETRHEFEFGGKDVPPVRRTESGIPTADGMERLAKPRTA